uniref:Costars family protein ABRACL n=2 Tax=Sarcophilus harrisii TaxID=9305 RepID=A0A7N4P617_SARHA
TPPYRVGVWAAPFLGTLTHTSPPPSSPSEAFLPLFHKLPSLLLFLPASGRRQPGLCSHQNPFSLKKKKKETTLPQRVAEDWEIFGLVTWLFPLFYIWEWEPRSLTHCAHQNFFRSKNLATMNVEHEISLLVEEMQRLGTRGADGKLSVKFGVLFQDDRCANLFEALVGTLKAAKRRKIVTYEGELLLQGVHDNVEIVLLQN